MHTIVECAGFVDRFEAPFAWEAPLWGRMSLSVYFCPSGGLRETVYTARLYTLLNE